MAESYLNRLYRKSYSKVSLSVLIIINADSRLLSIFLSYSFRMDSFASEWIFNIGKVILVADLPQFLLHVLQYLLCISSKHQSIAPGRVLRTFPTSHLNGMLRITNEGSFWSHRWLVCLRTKREQLVPHDVDIRVYAVISFSYFLLSCFSTDRLVDHGHNWVSGRGTQLCKDENTYTHTKK